MNKDDSISTPSAVDHPPSKPLGMKLDSWIPGVTVRLTPNPLRCMTTLSESARRELRLLLACDTLCSRAYSAQFDLEHDGQTFGAGPPMDGKARALNGLKVALAPWVADGPSLLERYLALAENADEYIAALNEQHAGDCVKIACSCSRCHIEDLIGIDTRPGDTDSRSYLWGIYAESDDIDPADIPWRDEQRKRVAELNEKYPPRRSDKIDYSKWEPIWAANKAKAIQHYAEHRAAYAAQCAHAKGEGPTVPDGAEAKPAE